VDLDSSWLFLLFFSNLMPTCKIYVLSLHDALPICQAHVAVGEGLGDERVGGDVLAGGDAVERLGDVDEGDAELGGLAEEGLRRRSEEHTSELQSRFDLVCRLLLEKKNKRQGHKQPY